MSEVRKPGWTPTPLSAFLPVWDIARTLSRNRQAPVATPQPSGRIVALAWCSNTAALDVLLAKRKRQNLHPDEFSGHIVRRFSQ